MKKLRSLALVAACTLAFSTGCSPKAAEQANASGSAAPKDGTYSVSGQPDERGWIPELELVISGGKITGAVYDEVAAVRKSESLEYQRTFRENTKKDLSAVYTALQTSLVQSQDASKIEAVAGATQASESIKALAAAALKDAKEGDLYKDGDYKATGSLDDKGWTPIVAITVKDGRIKAVSYDEISSKVFKNKSKDSTYINDFKAQKKIDLTAVYEALQEALIAQQDPTKVDAYSGATHAHDSFVALAAQALQEARKK